MRNPSSQNEQTPPSDTGFLLPLSQHNSPVLLVGRGCEAVTAEHTSAVLTAVSATVSGLAHAEHLATECCRSGQLLQVLQQTDIHITCLQKAGTRGPVDSPDRQFSW